MKQTTFVSQKKKNMITKSDLEHEHLHVKLNRLFYFIFLVANLNMQYVNILSVEEMNRTTIKKKGRFGRQINHARI